MDNQPKGLQITFTLPSDLKIGERARTVLSLRFDHPEWSMEQIAQAVGVSGQRVSQILNHPRILAAMPLVARQRVSGMVPKATRAMEEMIDQKDNLAVREKVVTRVLADKKVLDAPEIIVKNEITIKSTHELEQMLRGSAEVVPSSAIDADFIESTAYDTTQSPSKHIDK